jgi:transposase
MWRFAELCRLSWHTVKEIHKRHLNVVLEPVDRSRVIQLLIDEFATHKIQRYATVVVAGQRKHVLWVGRGRSRESIRPFFAFLGDRRTATQAVAIDMSRASIDKLAEQCPNAAVICDHFHIVAQHGHEIIDRVRVEAANRYRDDPDQRKVIKGSRWLLLRNPESSTRDEDRRRLDELLAANHEIATVYIMKDQLNHMETRSNSVAARAWWSQWYRMAIDTGILPLIRCARKLPTHLEGLVAYGFRDEEYFFLRNRHAVPTNLQ